MRDRINRELFEKVILKLKRMRHKEHFDMDVMANKTSCGTSYCIAGLGLIMSGFTVDDHKNWKTPAGRACYAWESARKLFGLTNARAVRAFIFTHWPEQFDEPDPKTAAKRLEHFLATNGKE